ncbi:hypothetical protein C9374_010942 [Naegleria lovaniensis]|uniref:DUF4246 domain-containing protein n=1 Tax=Naegleria lovaniensis TaxID=51637 RepID=A0AA88GAX7_NAELO|nr:uncharacterized protein C9374_010942 [Naegleria lovaniensis]KAG2374372.1 hypothetical protein C9374_010942 [Naegleria lovaniensis]
MSSSDQQQIENLIQACESGDLETVEGIIEENKVSMIDQERNSGGNALYWACSNGNLEVAEHLLRHGNVDVNYLNTTKQENSQAGCVSHETALHVAVEMDFPEMVSLLLDHRASWSIKNHNGETPYALARKLKHEDCKRLLVKKVQEYKKRKSILNDWNHEYESNEKKVKVMNHHDDDLLFPLKQPYDSQHDQDPFDDEFVEEEEMIQEQPSRITSFFKHYDDSFNLEHEDLLDYEDYPETQQETQHSERVSSDHEHDDDDKISASSCSSPIQLPPLPNENDENGLPPTHQPQYTKKLQISPSDVEWIVEQIKHKSDWISKYPLYCEKWKSECLSDTIRISEESVQVAFKILEDLRNDFLGVVPCCGKCNTISVVYAEEDDLQFSDHKKRKKNEKDRPCWCPCHQCTRDYTLLDGSGYPNICLIQDHRIPNELGNELRQELFKLEHSMEESEKDYHPGSNGQVLDLIHPSLYCFHYLHSTLREDSPFRENEDDLPDCSWLPTWFHLNTSSSSSSFSPHTLHDHLNDKKDCNNNPSLNHKNNSTIEDDMKFERNSCTSITYESYINNICQVKQQKLAQLVCEIMKYFVPMWEVVLQKQLPHRFQVIVKAANIIVKPERPYYPGGTWHTEGLYENIVATGIYYYESENVKSSLLDFRKSLSDDDMDERTEAKEGNLKFEILGSVETKQDRCVAFPNTNQHRVKHFFPTDPTKPAIRKILVFFLVDPENPIVSTRDVDVQRLDHLLNRYLILCKIIPFHLLRNNILQFLPHMTLKRAQQCRLDLMDQRKYHLQEENEEYEQVYSKEERLYSLCEH